MLLPSPEQEMLDLATNDSIISLPHLSSKRWSGLQVNEQLKLLSCKVCVSNALFLQFALSDMCLVIIQVYKNRFDRIHDRIITLYQSV